MDPKGKGTATVPMKFKGKYITKSGRALPLGHRSVVQSLMWLSGSKKRNQRGFMSDSRFTKADREVLANFIRASWDEVKGTRV